MGFWSDLWKSITTVETAQERANRRGAEKAERQRREDLLKPPEREDPKVTAFRRNVYSQASGGQATTGAGFREWSKAQPGYKPPPNPFRNQTTTQPAAAPGGQVEAEARAVGEGLPEMSSANYQVLQRLGWEVPTREKQELDLSVLDMDSSEKLTPFSYQMDVDELSRMTQTYQGQPGFKGRSVTNLEEDDPRLKVTGSTSQSAPMTWEAYNALDDDKKRAVDFNTVFIKAREKDLAGRHTPSKEEKAEYAQDYMEVFGSKPKDGEEYLAPNVVNLLSKIGFQAKGQDLDEYMAGQHLVTLDELDTFDTSNLNFEALTEGPNVMADFGDNNYATAKGAENLRMIDAALVDAAGSFITEAFETNPDAWDFASALSYEFFGTPPEDVTVPWGFGREEMRDGNDPGKDDWFRMQYNGLRRVGDIDIMWSEIEQQGLDEQDQQELFNYMDLKTKRDIAMGLIDPGDDEVLGAKDIRALLGLDEVT